MYGAQLAQWSGRVKEDWKESKRARSSECCGDLRNAVLGVFHRRVDVATKTWADSCMGRTRRTFPVIR